MKQIAMPVGILVLVAACGAAGWYTWRERHVETVRTFAQPPPEYTPDMKAATEANNHFALDLYARLAVEQKGNLFFSPYSVHTALAMTATGARGNTQAEMKSVLHLPDDEKLFAAGDLGKFYAHPRRDIELSVANAIWGQKEHGWRPEWLALQSERFGSQLQEADFAGNANTERLRINQWVEAQTRKRIADLLKEGQITSQTVQVLVNAIYFKGKWADKFEPEWTKGAPFHLVDGREVDVPMMSRIGKYSLAAVDHVSLLDLRYDGGEFSLLVILPHSPTGVTKAEELLNPATLSRWIAALKERDEISLLLPRFKIQQRSELDSALESLGMKLAYEPTANFTGMSRDAKSSLSFVAHEAFVEINEEGTEASAATGEGSAGSSGEAPRYEQFHADHPFLFLIRDAKHGTILFMGRVMNPLAK